MKGGWNKYCIYSFITTIILGLIMAETETNTQQEIEQATFGAGCFWCVEAIFERLNGVMNVRAGYTGGKTEKPTYEEMMMEQIQDAIQSKGKGDLEKILLGNNSWEVK